MDSFVPRKRVKGSVSRDVRSPLSPVWPPYSRTEREVFKYLRFANIFVIFADLQQHCRGAQLFF